jgi:hypothetical protein
VFEVAPIRRVKGSRQVRVIGVLQYGWKTVVEGLVIFVNLLDAGAKGHWWKERGEGGGKAGGTGETRAPGQTVRVTATVPARLGLITDDRHVAIYVSRVLESGHPGTAVLIIHDRESRFNSFEEDGCLAYAGLVIHDRETCFNGLKTPGHAEVAESGDFVHVRI